MEKNSLNVEFKYLIGKTYYYFDKKTQTVGEFIVDRILILVKGENEYRISYKVKTTPHSSNFADNSIDSEYENPDILLSDNLQDLFKKMNDFFKYKNL